MGLQVKDAARVRISFNIRWLWAGSQQQSGHAWVIRTGRVDLLGAVWRLGYSIAMVRIARRRWWFRKEKADLGRNKDKNKHVHHPFADEIWKTKME